MACALIQCHAHTHTTAIPILVKYQSNIGQYLTTSLGTAPTFSLSPTSTHIDVLPKRNKANYPICQILVNYLSDFTWPNSTLMYYTLDMLHLFLTRTLSTLPIFMTRCLTHLKQHTWNHMFLSYGMEETLGSKSHKFVTHPRCSIRCLKQRLVSSTMLTKHVADKALDCQINKPHPCDRCTPSIDISTESMTCQIKSR